MKNSNASILIASDHAGVELKAAIQKLLPKIDWMDLGPVNNARVDYPDYAERVATKISRGEATQGILICGSGIGMSIAANKIDGIRAAVVENPVSARLAREHNDANILCLGARFLAPEYAVDIIEAYLSATFAEGRHTGRVLKITGLEEKNRQA